MGDTGLEPLAAHFLLFLVVLGVRECLIDRVLRAVKVRQKRNSSMA